MTNALLAAIMIQCILATYFLSQIVSLLNKKKP